MVGEHLLVITRSAQSACRDLAFRKVITTATISTSSRNRPRKLGKGSVSAMSWHSILGVAFDAGYSDIRAAFKRRVLEAHPDKGGSAHEFQEIMFAFEKATCAVPTDGSVARKTACATRSCPSKGAWCKLSLCRSTILEGAAGQLQHAAVLEREAKHKVHQGSIEIDGPTFRGSMEQTAHPSPTSCMSATTASCGPPSCTEEASQAASPFGAGDVDNFTPAAGQCVPDPDREDVRSCCFRWRCC